MKIKRKRKLSGKLDDNSTTVDANGNLENSGKREHKHREHRKRKKKRTWKGTDCEEHLETSGTSDSYSHSEATQKNSDKKCTRTPSIGSGNSSFTVGILLFVAGLQTIAYPNPAATYRSTYVSQLLVNSFVKYFSELPHFGE